MRTLVFATKVGSAPEYSMAMALVDCLADTSGPCDGVSGGACRGPDRDTRLNFRFKLIGQLLEPLHFLSRQRIHVEVRSVVRIRAGQSGEVVVYERRSAGRCRVEISGGIRSGGKLV